MKANKLTAGANLRWESSRMMLPEHVAALGRHKIDAQKVERPELSDEQRQEIQAAVQIAIGDQRMVEISYYNRGFIRTMIRNIVKIESVKRRIKIVDSFGISGYLDFVDILDVK